MVFVVDSLNRPHLGFGASIISSPISVLTDHLGQACRSLSPKGCPITCQRAIEAVKSHAALSAPLSEFQVELIER